MATEDAPRSSGSDTLARLLDLSRAYKLSRALNLAGSLGLFTILDARPQGMTCAELVARLGWSQAPGFRGATDFFDLLVALDCLDRTGSGESATYSNAAATAPFLVQGSDQYIGGLLTLNHSRCYVQLEYLEDCLRDGHLPAAAESRIPGILDTFTDTGTAARDFAHAMTGCSVGNFTALATRFDWSRHRSVGDVGGSTGCLCVAVCRQHAHMSAVTYDLPAVHGVADEYVAHHNMGDRVKVADLDFFDTAPFPSGHDVITMGMVLHDWGLDKKQRLIRKAFEALPAGGAFIAVENLIDDDRRVRRNALAMSIDMLCEFGDENAFDFTFQEFTGWALEAGFLSTEVVQLTPCGTAYAAVARK